MSETGQFVTVGRVEEIAPGTARRVMLGEVPVAVFNVDGEFFAVDDTCTHAEASLSEGEVYPEECAVECPLHGSLFDLRTGQPRTLPAVLPVRTYPVRVENGEVRVGG